MSWLEAAIRYIVTGKRLNVVFLVPYIFGSLTREPELQDWIQRSKPQERKQYPLTDEITSAIDRFYFNHYCSQWRSGAFARANSSMYDDSPHILHRTDKAKIDQ